MQNFAMPALTGEYNDRQLRNKLEWLIALNWLKRTLFLSLLLAQPSL